MSNSLPAAQLCQCPTCGAKTYCFPGCATICGTCSEGKPFYGYVIYLPVEPPQFITLAQLKAEGRA